MNFEKWIDSGVSIEKLARKLCEEAGEVAKEIVDAEMCGVQGMTKFELRNLISEAKQSAFIASEIAARAETELQSRTKRKAKGNGWQ